MRKKILLFLFQFSIIGVSAQENIGLNPPSIKWRQISAPAGRIIFPEGLDSAAYHTAGLMHYQMRHPQNLSGKKKLKPIPTILQNQSSMPAGFATPAPWRNELYLTPPQNLFTGPVPWLDYVSIHEYRHAQQFQVANKGFTLPFKILMGETGWLLHALFNQPLWFREGDAVTTETVLTKAGRGRQPRFHMEYRAMRLSGYHFNYEKANMPVSFKHFIPNPYRIGYYMTTKLRRDFSDTIWQKVLRDTYHQNPIYGFNRSLKKHTGSGTKAWYGKTVNELDSVFEETDKNLVLTPARILTKPDPKIFTNYRFPHNLPDGSILILKDAFNEIRTFYKIRPDGSEEKLFPYGIYTDDHLMFSASGNLFTWAESSYDERWINQDYAIIKIHNLLNGKTEKLTSKTRYFAPALSPDAQKIVAVHNDKTGKNSLVILEATTGRLIKEIPAPGNAFLAQPKWQEDSNNVISIAVTSQGNSFLQTNSLTGENWFLLPFTTVPISQPFSRGEFLYFSAGFSGIDNIYALQLGSIKIYQVTSVRFGANEPMVSPDGKKLLYSNYTAQGYELAEVDLNPENWQEYNPTKETDLQFHLPLLAQPDNRDLTDSTFKTNYPVKKYRALTDGLFNFYGWFPTFSNNQYGAEFYTRNLMSTLRGTVGVFYNSAENSIGSKATLTYAALYPVFDLEYGLQTRRKAETRTGIGAEIVEQDWQEKYWLAGLKFPFQLTQGKYRTGLEIGGGFGHYNVNISEDPQPEIGLPAASFNAYRGTLEFSRILPQARQHVKPRWGQTATFNFQKAINENPEYFKVTSGLFFPGITKSHSFNLEGRWKKETVQNTYRFPDNFMMPRGYRLDPFQKIWVASANYEFPIWYPDLALGRVLFFQRLRTNLYYDYSQIELATLHSNLNATGAELFIDTRFLRLFSATMGFRYNHTFTDGIAETQPFQFVVTRFELVN